MSTTVIAIDTTGLTDTQIANIITTAYAATADHTRADALFDSGQSVDETIARLQREEVLPPF